MRKKVMMVAVALLSMALLTGCCISHDWQAATCTEPKTCAKCGETEGEVLAHTWVEATCSAPKTCSVCGETEGEVLAHTWVEATCSAPKTCSVCGETEGEVLAHTWVEATCSAPKTCSVCGETEGEALEHIFTEANYQQPATCTVCGTTEGDVLTPSAVTANFQDSMELDTVYDIRVAGSDDRKKTTLAKVQATNYRVFESDEYHPAKEGYEWKTVELHMFGGDENAVAYGFFTNHFWWDYYNYMEGEDSYHFGVSYNGIDYLECEQYCDFEYEIGEQFGWPRALPSVYYMEALVPKDYDGFLVGIYNVESNFAEASDYAEVDTNDYRYFRFQ